MEKVITLSTKVDEKTFEKIKLIEKLIGKKRNVIYREAIEEYIAKYTTLSKVDSK